MACLVWLSSCADTVLHSLSPFCESTASINITILSTLLTLSLQEAPRKAGDAPPETAEQLEARVAAEPDSSMGWIRYVAYLLSTGDIVAARGVAERALQTINYRRAVLKLGASRKGQGNFG